MASPLLAYIIICMLLMAAVSLSQRCLEKCHGEEEEVSFIQNLLHVDASRSMQVQSQRHVEHKGLTTMYAVQVSEKNPEPCDFQVFDMTGKPENVANPDAQSVSCSPHFERAVLTNIPVPEVTEGKALVRMAYSAVNPCDYKNVLGLHDDDLPFTPGFDFSGVVEKAGADCQFKPGDRVWGDSGGAWAQFNLAKCDHMGLMPSSMDFKEAGVASLVTGTSRAAFEFAGAPWTDKPTILVLGGTSGTGLAAIQLAKAFGAGKVITTCSEANFGSVKSLGADQTIDYHVQNFWEVLPNRSVDIVYDTVGIWGTGDHAYDILKDGGWFLTLLVEAAASDDTVAKRPKVHQQINDFNAMPSTDTSKLDMIKDLAEAGKFTMPVWKTFGIDQVPAALEESYQGHSVGKVAIQVATL